MQHDDDNFRERAAIICEGTGNRVPMRVIKARLIFRRKFRMVSLLT